MGEDNDDDDDGPCHQYRIIIIIIIIIIVARATSLHYVRVLTLISGARAQKDCAREQGRSRGARCRSLIAKTSEFLKPRIRHRSISPLPRARSSSYCNYNNIISYLHPFRTVADKNTPRLFGRPFISPRTRPVAARSVVLPEENIKNKLPKPSRLPNHARDTTVRIVTIIISCSFRLVDNTLYVK